jgi:hypothetical protein
MTKIEMMKKIDANGDGQLSLEEFCQLYENETFSIEIRNRGKIKFFELDVDHNGYLGTFLYVYRYVNVFINMYISALVYIDICVCINM